MAKLPRLPHVKFVKAKGRVYAYFNTGTKKDGKPIYHRMPDPSSAGFFESYASFKAGRTRRSAPAYTVAKLVEDFLASADYQKKSQATKDLYRLQLGKIIEPVGHWPVDGLEHHDIQTMIDGEGWGTATRNSVIAAIGAAYLWGRTVGKAKIKPVEDFKRIKGGEHAPWPDHVLEAALASDDANVRLPVHLLYFTGQRIGDVLRMQWTAIKDGMIAVRQQKTGKLVYVPMTRELREELDRTPKAELTILGRAASKKGIEQVRDILQAFAADHGAKVVTHGLRKNAVNALLEAGCTIAETAAITGQSFTMVEHYARQVDQQRLGQAAIVKFDIARKKSHNRA